MLDQSSEHPKFLFAVDDFLCFTEDHYRAIVHRMMKGGAREDEPVEDRHRDAGLDTASQRAQQPGCGRAREVEIVTHARLDGGEDHGTAFAAETGGTDHGLVGVAANGAPLEGAEFGQPVNSRLASWL